ncbi:Hypp1351 [Branchiostoma lanceolatum]|uniref:Hypp1351 protein n=1 Tax=Branchiostoma lanceolatum TaxID=7740 RepID=A0A8J9ZGT6_BRALA|nr:Hypp1351 [Branchiostoma lanceolatum]
MRRRAVSKKKAIIARKYGFKPKGAQPRLLTWDAIEHIYFLRAEYPKDWPLQRLAEGFGVDVDMIVRVLKNKNRPLSEEKRAIHDQQAQANRRRLGLPALPPIQPEQRVKKALPQGLKKALPQTNLKMLSPVQKEMVHHLGQMKQRLEQRHQRAITAGPGTEEENIVQVQKHEPQHLDDIAKGIWKPQQVSKDSRSGHSGESVGAREDSGGDDYTAEDIDFELMQERFEDIVEKYPNVDDDEEVVEKDGQFFTKDGDFLYKV